MKFFARLLNPRFQFFFFAVLALFVTGLVLAGTVPDRPL